MFFQILYEYARAYLIGAIIGLLITSVIFAFACYKIVQGKGYPEETCFYNAIGGFFLSWIWLIVVICKPTICAVGGQELRREDAPRVDYGGMSLGAFLASTTFAIALSAAGIVTMMLWSWRGLALVGVGVGILTIIYNKV